ncbi:MAG TPA: type III pantothenate kinase [Rhodospirillaceae bacterium]|nr:pantothenate kinase [Rhodospirillaceae bacterium]HAA90884.1 type III pantothenate kinase [Rhodospirillaceae bacterium]HAT36625.1 type III pantothenate kinase [Rhodospirillaceae bacterium]
MLLAIDSGNTNVVFAIYDGEDCRVTWRCGNHPKRTADEYAVWLTQLLDLEGLASKDIDGAILASVVPEAKINLIQLCQQYLKCAPMLIDDPEVDLGLDIMLERPDHVGDDRIANAVAAYGRFGGPLIIVDFGTATTFDVIDAAGNYTGGIIAPGVNLSVEALYQAAARLPRISVEQPSSVIGKSTVPAMQSGVFWGYVGLIEGLIARITQEYGQELKAVATGGLAQIFTDATDSIEANDPDMTTRGLAQIYLRNAK